MKNRITLFAFTILLAQCVLGQIARAQTVTRGPYLQMATPTNLVVRWRTSASNTGCVRYGLAATSLTTIACENAGTTDHSVTLTGLTPDTQYFYSVGTSGQTLAGGPDYTFFTPPPGGTPQSSRIWVLGDCGTAKANAASVRTAYTTFTGSRYTDVWLLLGDNAYDNGTDDEYQAAFFGPYAKLLRQTAVWSTLGNHETAGSKNPSATLPYFQIFSFPTNGEAGGAPSGTEKYYSFDFSHIHFIVLDSQTSSRATNSPMCNWLRADLAACTSEWRIAYWHHPPYSKNIDSDKVQTEIQMRQNIGPILERGGVDLVFSGHSHSYERSYLINGHYGLSTTLKPSMILDRGNGRENSNGAYHKPAGGGANQGTVYVVAGSGGATEAGPLNHPAMYLGFVKLGSVVLDIDGERLDAKFLRSNGVIADYFTILKDVP